MRSCVLGEQLDQAGQIAGPARNKSLDPVVLTQYWSQLLAVNPVEARPDVLNHVTDQQAAVYLLEVLKDVDGAVDRCMTDDHVSI